MKKIILFTVALMAVQNLSAQEPIDLNYYLPQGITYNENIPTPKEIIGHEVGEWHITQCSICRPCPRPVIV